MIIQAGLRGVWGGDLAPVLDGLLVELSRSGRCSFAEPAGGLWDRLPLRVGGVVAAKMQHHAVRSIVVVGHLDAAAPGWDFLRGDPLG